MYLEIEKNCSHNTLRSYAYDLKCYKEFLIKQIRSLDLHDI
ncbi:site-specific integrase [Thermaerobacillus caldiproteolyticus]